MDQAWHYTHGGEQVGPVEWAELQRLAAAHQLAPNDKVWTAGFTEWVIASSVRDLFAPARPPGQAIAAPTPIAAPQAVAYGQFQSSAAAAVAGFPGMPVIDYAAIGGERLSFAGFFARFGASFIDGLIIVAIGFVLSMGFMWFVGEDAAHANAQIFANVVRVVFVLVGWIYCATMESGAGQSTFGKRLLGLKVTDMSGNRISFARASARHFGKFLSQIIFMIGFLMMKFSPNNQCLHDMLAGCVVLKKEWS